MKRMFYNSSLNTIEEAYAKALQEFREVGSVNNEILTEEANIKIADLIKNCIVTFKTISYRKKQFQELAANSEKILEDEKVTNTLSEFDIAQNSISVLINSLKSISEDLGYVKEEPTKEDEVEDSETFEEEPFETEDEEENLEI